MQYTADGNRSAILAACWQFGHRHLSATNHLVSRISHGLVGLTDEL